MNIIKISIALALAMIGVISAAAQSFYDSYGKKIPIEQAEGMKVIYSDHCMETPPLPPGKGDSITDIWNDNNKCLVIYQEGKTKGKAPRSSASNPDSLCIYPCYIIEPKQGELVPTGNISITLKSLADTTLLKKICEQYRCSIIRQSKITPTLFRIKMIPGVGRNPILIANAIYETGYFLLAYPLFSSGSLLQISYDPKTTSQWGLYNAMNPSVDISVSTAWNYATGRGVRIAIIDSGIDIYHEDLFERIYTSYDIVTHTPPSRTDRVHGTMCAGIAAATRNNDKGIAGVAPDAMLMPVSISTGIGSEMEDVGEAINWAWENGADIISCSLGSRYDVPVVRQAINNAVTKGRNGKGCIVVASAGNINPSTPNRTEIMYPAAYPEVIAVGNLDKDGTISSSSCYGPNMCVVAPGTDIISTTLDNGYVEASGTSMACPHVAGVAALILQRNPALTAAQVRNIIVGTAQKIGPLNTTDPGSWDQKYGYGLVNASAAVRNTPRKQ